MCMQAAKALIGMQVSADTGLAKREHGAALQRISQLEDEVCLCTHTSASEIERMSHPFLCGFSLFPTPHPAHASPGPRLTTWQLSRARQSETDFVQAVQAAEDARSAEARTQRATAEAAAASWARDKQTLLAERETLATRVNEAERRAAVAEDDARRAHARVVQIQEEVLHDVESVRAAKAAADAALAAEQTMHAQTCQQLRDSGEKGQQRRMFEKKVFV
jgi:hypothetical protein